jgi:hypothetical protein
VVSMTCASCKPTNILHLGGDMIEKSGFRKAVRSKRGVGRVVVYLIAPVAERVEKGPTMWVHWCFRKEKQSGECWSSILTMSTREGLMAPTF